MSNQIKTWRSSAIESIVSGLLEWECKFLAMGEPVNWEGAKRHISREFYPFGERNYHPYKIWLNEVSFIEPFLKLNEPVRNYRSWRERTFGKKKPKISPGQTSLFN